MSSKNFMVKIITLILSVIMSQTVYSSSNLPEIIDMRKLDGGCENYNPILQQLGVLSFNSASEVMSIIATIKHEHNIKTAIETGTFKGNTTIALALLFDKVFSVEIYEENYKKSLENLVNFKNVNIMLKSSEKALTEILSGLKNERVFFYLDAHWNEYWPILDELEEISKTHKDNCIVMVDDVQVPNSAEIPYDEYQGQPLSYEYLKPKLNKVFHKYSVHYIIPKDGNNRAKLLIIPSKL